jgi:polysaccharide biosynthesis transport protein
MVMIKELKGNLRAEEPEMDLQQYWLRLRRRWVPALLVFASTAATISFLGFSKIPMYEAEGQLRFKGEDATAALTGIEDDNRGELKPLNFQENPVETEVGLMRTAPVIRETIEKLGLKNDQGELIEPSEFLSNLQVDSEPGTDLLKVVYRSPSLEVSQRAVDTLMAVYLKQHLLENRAEAIAAREFIEKQLPDAESRALQAEAALRNFKERNQIVALEPETLETVSALRDVSEKITDVTSELADAEAQFTRLEERVGSNPQASLLATSVSQSEGIQQLLEEYQSVETTLASEQVRFQDEHPTIVDLKNKLENLNAVLGERVAAVAGDQSLPAGSNLQVGEVEAALVGDYVRLEAKVDGLRQQSEVLSAAQQSYSARADVLPQLEQEQNELERRLEAAQSTYSSLLKRLQEVRIAENQNVGNVRIVQPAEAMNAAVSPNKKLFVATGLMLGSLLAISTAALLEARDKSIKTVEDAKKSLQLPILGIIPTFPVSQANALSSSSGRMVPQLVVDEVNYSLPSEVFHMLRSNLKFLDLDNAPKVIAVTSSVSGEGKSTVASNLAASIAQTGKLVLLIDADFHRPSQQWIWNISNRYGLSDLLVGDISLLVSVQPVRPNLMVITAGSVPPNPASLLDSQKMLKLLQAFRNRFDYIIIDTPPLSAGASTSILGKMSDGLLFVLRPKVADVPSVNYAKELIARFQQTVLGAVINGTLNDYEPYNYFLSGNSYDVRRADLAENSYQEIGVVSSENR